MEFCETSLTTSAHVRWTPPLLDANSWGATKGESFANDLRAVGKAGTMEAEHKGSLFGKAVHSYHICCRAVNLSVDRGYDLEDVPKDGMHGVHIAGHEPQSERGSRS